MERISSPLRPLSSSSPLRNNRDSSSPNNDRSSSPSRIIPLNDSELYKGAMKKIMEAAWRFDRERNGQFLKLIENKGLDKELFRQNLRLGFDCRLSREELDSVLPHFNNDGKVDGCEFILLFYKVRFEYRAKILSDRLAKERKYMNDMKEEEMKKKQELDAKSKQAKVSYNYSEQDYKSALDKLLEAAVLYDRNMPGAVQLVAFDCEYMVPVEFKEQLKRAFNLTLSANELGALIRYIVKDDNQENINCAQFLIMFFRMGYEERNRRMKYKFEEKKRINDAKELKMKEDLAILETKNALKCKLEFTPEDQENILFKLRTAARLYDKSAPGAMSLRSFEVLHMEPHVFKEQLKRVFNLKVTPGELGVLMSIYDPSNEGKVVCADFTQNFLALGYSERERELRESLEKQRKAEELRKQEEQRKKQELESKNAQKFSFEYTQEDYDRAMVKLVEASCKFDKSGPGVPNLTAFESRLMEPVVFKEQLKRAFNMNLTPPELGAIIKYYNPDDEGNIVCKDFLNRFTRMGIEERTKQRVEYLKKEAEIAEIREKEAAAKAEAQAKKILLQTSSFTEDHFKTALTKLTKAAFKFEKAGSTAPLDAFELHSLPAHIFKEQLKIAFNVNLSIEELGAVMSYFDKDGTGEINCKEFLIQFSRTGFEERNNLRRGWREEQKRKDLMIKQEEENRKKELLLKSMNEVDYEFTEQDFDIALSKLIEMCHRFDQRQLGPAGWAAFTSMSLTPSEFREMAKRTFNLKVNPRELGALVTYFDVQMKGVVNCNSFMNTFVKIRVYCEPLKGTPTEGEELLKYHADLKEQYKLRIQRQLSGEGATKVKPWAQGAQAKPVTKEAKEKKKKPFPTDPLLKIKLRSQSAPTTNKMDLSTRDVWSDDDEISHSARAIKKYHNPLRHEADHVHVERAASPTKPTPVKVKFSPNSSIASLGSKGSSNHHKVTITKLLTEAKKHDDKRFDADYRLINVPANVFRMLNLTELWMTNNAITSIPSEIADLKNLKLICFSNNELTTVAPEICLLPNLQRLYLRGNMLKELPDLFSRMNKLLELDIAYNNFAAFPQVLCKLPKLISLDISYNDLQELPDVMFEMRPLVYLNIMHNLDLTKYQVLSKMSWVMVHGLKQDKKPIPTGPKACQQFFISKEEEHELESLIKGRCMNKPKKRRNRV